MQGTLTCCDTLEAAGRQLLRMSEAQQQLPLGAACMCAFAAPPLHPAVLQSVSCPCLQKVDVLVNNAGKFPGKPGPTNGNGLSLV